MRISDWSSDVCSSDLFGRYVTGQRVARRRLLAEGVGQLFGRDRGADQQVERVLVARHARLQRGDVVDRALVAGLGLAHFPFRADADAELLARQAQGFLESLRRLA